jgi:hypothetical protein
VAEQVNKYLCAVVCALTIALTSASSLQVSAQSTLSVYTDALASGWGDWSWNITRNLSNAVPVHAGSHSVAVTFTQGWDGLQFGRNNALNLTGYDTLRFWIHGGASGGQQINVQVRNSVATVDRTIAATANTWTQVDVSLMGLSPSEVTTLVWWNPTANAQATFYLDDVAFVNTNAPPPQPSTGPALSVNVAADRHAISPYIYGMNYADEALAAELRLPVRRWGGNSTTRYNWQNNTYNTGSDWYFENILADVSADQFIAQDRRTNTQTIMTMPLIGWASKQGRASHPYDCGFRVSRYGAQPNVDPWDTDCGNSVRAGGVQIAGNDPADTSIAITPAFDQSWVQHLVTQFGSAANGGVLFYNLDNEPMLWNSTHRDIHPSATSYDELRDRTYQYAAAIKAGDSSAQILGPVLWGWSAYFYSALDSATGNADRAAHSNTPFLDWYLQQMRAYEQTNHARILDYLDVHYYPQASGVFSDQAGNAATQALRLRSTRALWDPTYSDESWINQTAEGPYVRLIPRMRDWVNNNYPGTKIALTEYSWGARGHINGALAQADVLGIFGRESLDLATLWSPPTTEQPVAFAFRMYRNYDGARSMFGDVSVRAASADQSQVSIYAAQRSSDGALTLMIVNKTATPLTSTLTLSNFAAAPAAQVYSYSANNLAAIVRQADQAVSADGFTATFPASSITLIVIPLQTLAFTWHVYLPLIRR